MTSLSPIAKATKQMSRGRVHAENYILTQALEDYTLCSQCRCLDVIWPETGKCADCDPSALHGHHLRSRSLPK